MVSGCKKASGSALPFKERLKIAVLLAQGMSLSAVANKVGCTVPTVRKWAKRSAQGSLDVLPRSGRPKKWGAKRKVASSLAHQREAMATRARNIETNWCAQNHSQEHRQRIPSEEISSSLPIHPTDDSHQAKAAICG